MECNKLIIMGISITKEEQVTDEILQKFVEGTLEVWIRPEVEKFLQKSKDVFQRYVEIKEMKFYESIGKPISKDMQAKVLDMIPKKSRILNHLLIRIRFLKDKVVVSSSDQEEMDYLGIMAEYAWRSSEPGSITIKRKMGEEEISIELIPGERTQEFLLAIQSAPGKELDCELCEKLKPIEKLKNISNRQVFQHPVQSTNKTDLNFIRNSEIIFTVSVFLIQD